MGFYLRKVQERNNEKKQKREVRSSNVHVGLSSVDGIKGTIMEPASQPNTRDPNLLVERKRSN